MEHWFDRATKVLARPGPARRDVLKGFILAGVGALLPKNFWVQGALAKKHLANQPVPPHPTPQPAACSETSVDGKRTVSLQRSGNYNGQLITLTHTSSLNGHRHLFGTISQRVELGGKTLYEFTGDFVSTSERTSSGEIVGTATTLGRVVMSFAPPNSGREEYHPETWQGWRDRRSC